jgi:hypothetical protein
MIEKDKSGETEEECDKKDGKKDGKKNTGPFLGTKKIIILNEHEFFFLFGQEIF